MKNIKIFTYVYMYKYKKYNENLKNIHINLIKKMRKKSIILFKLKFKIL